MHTAQHIVTHCLSGDLAKGRTIILITHHVRMCLSAASYIVELVKGGIARQGLVSEFSDLGVLDEVLEAEDRPFEELMPPEDQENEADLESKRNTLVVEPKKGASSGKLIEAEARAEGRVSFRTYWTYIKAAGVFSWVLTIIFLLMLRVINIGNQVGPGTLQS
jgi:ABC-type multidrug transport system ATPase subunit